MNEQTAGPVSEFCTDRRIEFADTDMAGIVHFARFFVFMETAEHEFLRSLGTIIHDPSYGRELGWPRVAAECDYLSPARFGDEIDIHLQVARKGTKSMTYTFEFLAGERVVARGRMSSVCCDMTSSNGLRAVPIPAELADRIAEHEPE